MNLPTQGNPSYWAYASLKDLVRAEGTEYLATWRIHYLSADSVLTVRTIEISHHFTGNSKVYLLAFCRFRRQERTFQVNRIQRAYDLTSSIRIQDPMQYVLHSNTIDNSKAMQTAKFTVGTEIFRRRMTNEDRVRLEGLRERAKKRHQIQV